MESDFIRQLNESTDQSILRVASACITEEQEMLRESVWWWIKHVPRSMTMQIKRDLFNDWDAVISGVTASIEDMDDVSDLKTIGTIRREIPGTKTMIEKRIANFKKQGKSTVSMERYQKCLNTTLSGLLTKQEAKIKADNKR